MKNTYSIISALLLVCAFSCTMGEKKNPETTEENDSSAQKEDARPETVTTGKADSLLAKTLAAHGGGLYDTAHYGFRFRKNRYTFHNENGSYTYTTTVRKDGKDIRDVLENGTFTRTINGTKTELSQKDITKYTEALNSVIYFATLPFKLQDNAVRKAYKGQTIIKGQAYDMLYVTFDADGGGTDFNDTFMYWINATTATIDYLAYSYATNDGGVRFRSAYDPRTVGGIRFQNYVNYEAPIDTPLSKLPALYETGALKELSRIETEDVVIIGN